MVYQTNKINEVRTKITRIALRSSLSLKVYSAPFIVVAMYGGSVGNIAISQIDACVNQACCCIKTDDNNILKYM